MNDLRTAMRSVAATAGAVLATASLSTPVIAAPPPAATGVPPLVLAQSTAAAGQPAGRIIMTTSNLRAQSEDGSVRALARHSPVFEGDTLVTGEGGITQVRMADGALLSLRRRTEFRIEEFNYQEQEDGSERGFFALLRGGFRTITGLIGSTNKQNYRVATPVATIGIRGTHFGLRMCIDGDCAAEGVTQDGLYGGVVDGGITSNNRAGRDEFDNDEYFHVAGADLRARSLLIPPGIVFGSDLPLPRRAAGGRGNAREGLRTLHPEADELNELVQAQSRRDIVAIAEEFRAVVDPRDLIRRAPPLDLPGGFVGTVPDTATLAPDGSVAHVSFLQFDLLSGNDFGGAYGVHQSGVTPQNLENASFIVIDTRGGAGNLVLATQNREDPCVSSLCMSFAPPASTSLVTGSVGGNAALGVNWGRWTGGVIASGPDAPAGSSPTGDLHFIFSDKLTPENAYSQLTGSFSYGYSGEGTAPTNHAGVEGVLNSASVGVDFGQQAITSYDLDLSVANDNVTASMSSSAVAFSAAASGDITLNAMCTGATCGPDASFAGRASTSFVGSVNNGRPDGLISSYALGGAGGDQVTQPIGFTGTFLATPR